MRMSRSQSDESTTTVEFFDQYNNNNNNRYINDSPPYYSTPSSSGVGSGGSSSAYSSYCMKQANESKNNCESEHIYEDIVPQRLPTISAVLQNKDKTAVVRPVAFKPTTSTPPTYPTHRMNRIATPTNLLTVNKVPPYSKNNIVDENSRTTNYSMSSSSSPHTGSLKLSLLRQFSLSQNSLCFDGHPNGDTCFNDKIRSSCSPSKSMLMTGSCMNLDDRQGQTPSPSDSGIAELEAILKEKDSEINHLRETLEQNEQIVYKVYEKQHNWKSEIGKIRAQYDNRLKMCQQRALKMEQLLMNQSYQLQQEKKKLTSAYDRMRKEKEVAAKQTSEYKKEIENLRSQLDETRWSLCQKNGEVSLLKSQLKDCQSDQVNKANELVNLKNQMKDLRFENDDKDVRVSDLSSENVRLRNDLQDARYRLDQCSQQFKLSVLEANNERNHRVVAMSEAQREIDKLKYEACEAKRALDYERGALENERIDWLEEKEKVIRYQKQLQLNYVQMFRRNHCLEREIQQLSIGLENRTSGGESHC